jgi:hypothetical protein
MITLQTHVGFTGTQVGCSPEQTRALGGLLGAIAASARSRGLESVLHHGDCVGADDEAHRLALELGYRVVVHPADNDRLALGNTGHELRPPRPYPDRNRAIVDESTCLVACPVGPERPQSWTWATVRYARRAGKPVITVWPSGWVDLGEVGEP